MNHECLFVFTHWWRKNLSLSKKTYNELALKYKEIHDYILDLMAQSLIRQWSDDDIYGMKVADRLEEKLKKEMEKWSEIIIHQQQVMIYLESL